jgi:hypothetical protein
MWRRHFWGFGSVFLAGKSFISPQPRLVGGDLDGAQCEILCVEAPVIKMSYESQQNAANCDQRVEGEGENDSLGFITTC